MSSGEVVFILAFIVLPTAVLVSSVWAILFVRRQPDRIIEREHIQSSHESIAADDDQDVIVDTVVLPTVARSEVIRSSDLDDEDELDPAEWDESDDLIEEQPASDDLYADAVDEEPMMYDESTGESASEREEQDESDIQQTTEDLDAVVAEVAANDTRTQHPEPAPEEEVEDTRITETSDLPVIERPAERNHEHEAPSEAIDAPDAGDESDEEQQQEAGASRWRRRKRPAPLRPSDPDAGRARGRNRDPQRQVPQLGRSTRRRDESSRDTPPDTAPDEPT